MRNRTANDIARAGLIGALYAALTMVLAPISYGPLQVRVSEALAVLPFFTLTAVPGLWIGCLAANFLSNAGIYDVVLGSFLTLVAAYFTYLCGRKNLPLLAPLPPVLINAFGVSSYLQFFYDPPDIPIMGGLPAYWLFVASIGTGEVIACYMIGLPLLFIIRKSSINRIIKDENGTSGKT